MESTPGLRLLLRYGIFGIPLAFAGLPLYVHMPKFYADTLHVNLAALGGLLLFIRLFDAIIDPLIGLASDRFQNHTRLIMSAAIPVLMLGYVMLFNPPAWAHAHARAWITLSLFVVYFSFSTLMINYYALGLSLVNGYDANTRLAIFREGSMLIGVLIASVLPGVLLRYFPPSEAYSLFSLVIVPLLIVCGACMLPLADRSFAPSVPQNALSYFKVLGNADVRWILLIAFLNAIPTAITSTLFLFFVSDVLRLENLSGLMLAAYFLSAALGMPLWNRLSKAYGKKRSLLIAMATAIACFIWAWRLQAGDESPFFMICVLTGMTLGADSALLPSLLADALDGQRHSAATGFGVWNLVNKLTMAFAAGLALPLLAYAGYRSGAANTEGALAGLSLCYGLLPCAFKAAAVVLLYVSPLDARRNA